MKISYILIAGIRYRNLAKKHKDKNEYWLRFSIDFVDDLVFDASYGLLALQSDLGTAVVFVAIFAGLVLLSGVFLGVFNFCSSCIRRLQRLLAIFITKDSALS